MIIIRHALELKEYLDSSRKENKKIGFVPTMGALHNGHRSLIDASRRLTDVTVCSIFVNPAQFNDPRDYEKYPQTVERDIQFLQEAEADLLFLPSLGEIYPTGILNLELYQLGHLENILEGQYRPGHFQGVCQVMSRLLMLVKPDKLFMGQKDYQQCMVIRRLLKLMQLNRRILFQVCPTVREADGLAMSSRNLRLNEVERKKAVAISQVLEFVKEGLKTGELTRLEIEASTMLAAKGFKVDYFEIARADTFELVNEWDGKTKLIALTAAFLNQVRLIDNMMLN